MKGEKHCEKRRKCWLPAFSPFPTMFSKGFLYRVVKSRDCVVKSRIFTRQSSDLKVSGNQHSLLFSHYNLPFQRQM